VFGSYADTDCFMSHEDPSSARLRKRACAFEPAPAAGGRLRRHLPRAPPPSGKVWLFAHATDTDDAVTPPGDSSLWLPGRQGRQEQTTAQTGKGCLGQGVQTPLLAFF